MPHSRKPNAETIDENRRLRAQVAQLEDRLDHLQEHGTTAKALQQAELLHQEVMGLVSDVVLMADEAGRITYASSNAYLIFGYTSAEILNQGRIGFLLPANLFDPDVLEQRGEIAHIECQIRDAVGRARNLLVTVRRTDRLGSAALFACRDVTERVKLQLDYELLSMTLERRVEEQTTKLRESRERYRRYVEGLRGEYLFYATSRDGTITYVSPSVHSILGYTPDQVVGQNWREFVDPRDPQFSRLEEYDRMRFAGLSTPAFILAPVRHANGDTRLLEFTDSQLRDADGCVVSNEGICRDITQRLAAEEALRSAHEELEQRVLERTAELTAANERLRESEQRYRSVVEDQLEFIVRWREDGTRTFVNESYCRYFGTTRAELIGGDFLSSVVEEDGELLRQRLASATADGPAIVNEQRVVMPDGRTVWQRWTHRAFFNSDGKLIEFQSVGCDITDRRKRDELSRERVVARVQLRHLSERERDVMRLVVAGDANKVIARKLGLSVKTIEKHRSSLMKKLHVRSVPELVRLALLADEAAAAREAVNASAVAS
jgi:PAS domain S-box-containing protein